MGEQRTRQLGLLRFAREPAFRPRGHELPPELGGGTRCELAGQRTAAPRERRNIVLARDELPTSGGDLERCGVTVRPQRAHVLGPVRHRLGETHPCLARRGHRRWKHVLERDAEQAVRALLDGDVAGADARGQLGDLATQRGDPSGSRRRSIVGHDRDEVRVDIGIGKPDIAQIVREQLAMFGERWHHAAHERGRHEVRDQIDGAYTALGDQVANHLGIFGALDEALREPAHGRE